MKLTLYYQESAELGSVSELKLGLNLMCYNTYKKTLLVMRVANFKISVQMYNTKLYSFITYLKHDSQYEHFRVDATDQPVCNSDLSMWFS